MLHHEFKKMPTMLSMHLQEYIDAGFLILLTSFLVPFALVTVTIIFWQTIPADRFPVHGMHRTQLVTYILLSFLFQEQFNITTPITESLWLGSIVKYYTRPLSFLYQVIMEMIGKTWLFRWLIFSIPMLFIAYFSGINIMPNSVLQLLAFLFSLLLSIVIGIAIDILFSALAIKMKNGAWSANRIKNILILFLSGQVVPLQLLPSKIREVLLWLPFGSLASAPLSIFVGVETDIFMRLKLQLMWCAFFSILAVYVFNKCEESMVSFGG